MTKHPKADSTTTTAHTRGVTLQDIANACGLSKCAVSLALRNHPRISKTTRERVVATAQQLGYNPGLYEGARRLALRKSGKTPINHVIALFFPPHSHTEGYFGAMFHGIMETLMEEGYGLLTLHSPNYVAADLTSSLWSLFTRGDVDGVVISQGAVDTRFIPDRLRSNPGFGQRPVMALVSPLPDSSLVQADDFSGGYQAAQHLLKLGHRHLLQCIFPSGEEHEQTHHRVEGISQAMREAGLDPKEHLHFYTIPLDPSSWMNPVTAPHHINGFLKSDDATPAMREFAAYLQARPEITGVLCLNDANALHVWQAASYAGLSVPEDLSIIGFDDTDHMLNEQRENILTTLHIDLVELGNVAAHEILRHIADPTAEHAVHTMPVELIVRGSTAPARSHVALNA